MPSKKGSKVAAAQARAKAAAKKKARQAGPTPPPAAYLTPRKEIKEVEEQLEESLEASTEPKHPTESVAARPQVRRQLGSRRERHAAAAVAGASLKRELGMIGGLTVVVSAALVILKLLTDLGA